MDEKYGFLYSVVNAFEQGDRSLRHNNYGAHLWTPELAEKFGARQGDPFEGTDGNIYTTAYYDDPEVGTQASNYIIDKIWEQSNGDSLAFASQYTGLPKDDPTTISYAQAITKSKSARDYQGAVERLENNKKLQKQKEGLYSEFPGSEKKIDKLIDTGQFSADGIRDEISKVSKNLEWTDEAYDSFKEAMTYMGLEDEAVGLKNSLLRGVENVKSFYHTTSIMLGRSPEEHIKALAVAQAEAQGIPQTEAMNEFMNPDNNFTQTIKKFGGDPIELTSQLFLESMTQYLPVYLPIATITVPTGSAIAGAPGAYVGNATASGLASYSIEMAHETISLMREAGVDVTNEEELAQAFLNEELMADIKVKANLKAIPIALLDAVSGGIAGRSIQTAKALGTPMATAVGKEIMQQAGLGGLGEFLGQGLQMDDKFQEDFHIPSIVAESVVEIGTGSVSGTVNILFDNGNQIEVPENDPLVQDIITAKEKQYQEPKTDVDTEYQRRVSGLTNYKDQVGIGFTDTPIQDVKTENELMEAGYNPAEFDSSLIKEGENEYVNDGVNRYRVTVQATNYEFGDGTRRVLLSPDATQSDFLEDTAEAVYSRMDQVNPELRGDIDGWINAVEQEAHNRGELLPYTRAELFSKSFLRSLGYDVALPDYTVMPDGLLDAFKQELALDDGTNLIDGMEVLDQMAEPTEAIEQSDVQRFARRIANNEDMSTPEDLQFYENNKEAIEQELTKISQEESPIGEDQFAITPETGYTDLEVAFNRLRRRNKPILKEGESLRNPKTFRKVVRRLERMTKKDLSALYDIDPDLSSIDLSPRKWYRADVDVTLSNTAEVHPEVYAQESYLLSLLGILSNGQPVATNYNQAGRVFGETENGKIPFTFYEKFHEKDGKWSRYDGLGKLQEGESPMGGVRGKKVAEQGKVLQQIIDKYGIENIDEFLLGSFTGHELKKMFPGTASHISNKADMNAKHYGAQVFGRKIGSYILNMHGIHEDAVLDVWMHRTFVRQTGGSKELKSNYNINEFRAHQEALKNVADDLAKTTGQPWGVDQVQALLWYNEKELYIQEGVKPEKGESYAKVSEKYAEVRGRRNVASSQDTGNTSSNEEGRNVDPRKSGQGAVSNDARAGNRRVDGRSSRANKRRGTGSTRSLRRLEPSEAPAFRRAISKAKTHNKFGSSVFIYSTAKYRGMKMFMSRNGAVGYAIKDDGDIVSVFHNKSIDSNSSALDALIPHAIENGGTKLDAFDTVLPRLYGKFGFVTTARDKWSDKYMPDGWDKKLYKKFNNGEPDVVYMELGVENPNTDLFSLKPTDKELADAFGGTPTKAELRASRRSERATKPKQLRDIIKSFSSQVNRINPMITQNVVKYQKAEADLLAEYMKPTTPFAQMLQKKKKKARTRRKKAEYMRLKLALLNSDSATIESILKGRDLKKYQAWRDAHDRMHDKAHAVGIDLGYIETHFPRQIINYDAFLQHVAGITSSGKTSKLLEAIRDAEAQIGRALTKEEKVGIANYLMRDQKGLIGQQHSDWSKNRKIDQVELEHARFYADPHIALQGYATGMSQQIARAQWLGGRPNRYTVRRFPKNADVNGVGIFDNKVGEFLRKDDNSLRVYRSRKDPGVSKILEVLRKEEQRRTGLSYMSIEDQVGGMLVKLQADHGGLTRGEEGRLRSLFVDYFKKGVMPTTANVMRNVGYITTMGSVFSAVTQLADLGVAVYRQGQGKFLGYLRPGTYASILKEMVASTVRLNKYKLKNLGLDQTILRELNDQHSPLERMMSFVFKATGLKAMDMIGKETYVNTAMKKYVKQAKMLQKGKNNKHTRMLLARLKRKFPQNEVDAIINDLATGKITELTELLAYSELLDIQPVADSELPIGYLRYNDGRRLFYMLKTFALKRLDVFVNEAQVLKKEAELLESQGKKVKAKQKRVQSMYHFMVLGTILAMAEAGADTIKDWMAGRKTPLDELVVSNMLKMFLISRYHYYNFINSKPSEAIIKMLMMPVDYIDDPARDVMYLAKRMDKYKNSRTASKYAWRDFKKRGAKSLRHFPILGKHLYWMDNDSEWKDVIDQYAPFIATGYGKRVMKERQKREQNK